MSQFVDKIRRISFANLPLTTVYDRRYPNPYDYGARGWGDNFTTEDTKGLLKLLANHRVVEILPPNTYYSVEKQVSIVAHNTTIYGSGITKRLPFGNSLYQRYWEAMQAEIADGQAVKSCWLVFQTPTGSDAQTKAVQTQRRNRLQESDPKDPAVRAMIANHAEGLTLQGLAVLGACDFSDTSKTNYGADYDYVFLNAGRALGTIKDNVFAGYARNATYLHANDLINKGNPYTLPTEMSWNETTPLVVTESPSNPRGTDRTRILHCDILGGKWGMQILGRVDDGPTTWVDGEGLVTNQKGSTGISDLIVDYMNLENEHHSGHRRYDGVDGVSTVFNKNAMDREGIYSEDAAGAVWIDVPVASAANPRAGSKVTFGTRCRIRTDEVFAGVRLGKVALLHFESPHIEHDDNEAKRFADSVAISDVLGNSYGEFTATNQTERVFVEHPSSFTVVPELWTDIVADYRTISSGNESDDTYLGNVSPAFGDCILLDDGDLDDVKTAGFYTMNNPAANGPDGTSAVFLEVKTFNTSVLQEATIRGGSTFADNRTYKRKFNGTSWTVWSYESLKTEGTFTPAFAFVNAPTYTVQTGTYITDDLSFEATVVITYSGLDTTDASDLTITGFPFSIKDEAIDVAIDNVRTTAFDAIVTHVQGVEYAAGGGPYVQFETANARIKYNTAMLAAAGTIAIRIEGRTA